ncbi:ABC transporter permease [Helicobacter muridarum]|uniref:ABC transporter permease n=1 Tax=Helicobacter muridarum TaxID=216 RepID=A0A377PV21_9HELI|nr:ABC transporter permease [Helicobacter muridarum]TLE00453.1 ABC transporter permease [Helicobacter muridarum]STQ86427.1 ABC-2 type transport system permease [Helicobacter muridarum]
MSKPDSTPLALLNHTTKPDAKNLEHNSSQKALKDCAFQQYSYSFLEVFLHELRAVCGNVTVMFVVMVGSILYALLYPSPYYKDIVLKQKIAVIDLDNTSLSKDFIFAVNASPNIEIAYHLYSSLEAMELLKKQEIYGILSIPKGFQANALKGSPTKLSYRANASYLLIYGTIIQGLNDIGSEFSSKIKHHASLVKNEINIAKDSTLIRIDSIPLFNDSLGYINYALSAIFIFILHQTLLAGSMLITAHQNKLHVQGIRGYFNQAPITYVVLARILVFTILYILLFLLYCGFFFNLYGIHVHASIIDFWCFSLMFIICSASFGIFIGSFIHSTALPTQIILLSSLPLVFMMGFIYPMQLLPSFLQSFISCIPAYHGVNALIRLNQMAASMNAIMSYFYSLCIIFMSCTLLSIYSLFRKYYR